RMVRDVIDWRGQTRLFLQRSHEVDAFPPIAVFWGESDSIIPVSHGRAFAETMPGAVFRSFPRAGHYVHRDCFTEVADALLEFLDDPNAQPVRPRAIAEELLSPPPAELLARAVPGFDVAQLAWKRLRVLIPTGDDRDTRTDVVR